MGFNSGFKGLKNLQELRYTPLPNLSNLVATGEIGNVTNTEDADHDF